MVNIASTARLGFRPYQSPKYGAAKARLIRFTASLAQLRGADERAGEPRRLLDADRRD